MKELTEERKMHDNIETFGKGTIIQHGHLNNRVYLMKLNRDDFPGIIDHINHLARDHAYTKIFCKVHSWAAPAFVSGGFIIEAQIPRFYNNLEDVFFMSKFLDSDRIMGIEHEMLEQLSRHLMAVPAEKQVSESYKATGIIQLSEDRADEIAGLYKQVFSSYPFPIFQPDYIGTSMQKNVLYYGIENNGKLVALASAETDRNGANAEMTDFATLPEFRGNNLSVYLLSEMETEMKKQGISTLYTIARLNSLPMNKTFLRLKYRYAGTLVKNTNIAGKIESMIVYYKHI